jgi:putative SOS response-associated peptidase YedK
MAGIWEDWLTADGSELDSAAILTTVANDTLRPIHHRMPVILEAADWDRWLDVSEAPKHDVEGLMRPAAEELLEAVPVSQDVNRIANDHPRLMDQVDLTNDTETARKTGKRAPGKKDDQLDLF